MSAPPPVPLAAPTRLWPDEAAAVRQAVAAVIDSERWILGPAVAGFEAAFADYVGAADCVGVASGTDALILALTCFDLPAATGVLVPANDGGFAAMAALRAGLTPIAMDVEHRSLLPGIENAEAAWRSSTHEVRAMVVTHPHGDAAPIFALDAWRRERGLVLIEDCAQAHGLRVGAQHVGTIGDAGTFSFYPTKNLGAVGDGGAVVFGQASQAAERARVLRQYGWEPAYRIAYAGGLNSRLDELQAAVLSARLRFLDARNQRRRQIADHLRTAAQSAGLSAHGEPLTTVAHHLVVRTPQRDALAGHLADAGIQTAIHYPTVLSQMPGLGAMAETPVARTLSQEVLSLPCFPELNDGEVERVGASLAAWSQEDPS